MQGPGATGSAQRKLGTHVLGKCLLKAVDIAGMIFIPAVLDGIEHVLNLRRVIEGPAVKMVLFVIVQCIFIGKTYRRRITPQFGRIFS